MHEERCIRFTARVNWSETPKIIRIKTESRILEIFDSRATNLCDGDASERTQREETEKNSAGRKTAVELPPPPPPPRANLQS